MTVDDVVEHVREMVDNAPRPTQRRKELSEILERWNKGVMSLDGLLFRCEVAALDCTGPEWVQLRKLIKNARRS